MEINKHCDLVDVSSGKWLTELGMEDPTLRHQYQILPFDNSLHGFNFESFSSESNSSYPSFSTSGASSSSTVQLISFGNSNLPPPPTDMQKFQDDLDNKAKPQDGAASDRNMKFRSPIPEGSYENQNYSPKSGDRAKRISSTTRNPLNHVVAERKRREKLTQRFIALSALLPGLKKMDKVSVLGDAAKYLKQLQERVQMLEEQTAMKTMESVTSVKKSDELCDNDQIYSDSCCNQTLLEIEARVSNKDVLIRIHCERQKGFTVKILHEIEKLHLTIVNNSCFSFGNYVMVVTVVAQMDSEFSMTSLKDLVTNLRLAFATRHVK